MSAERGLGKGLGRGLGALLGDAAFEETTPKNPEGGSVHLPIEKVEPGMNQPRKRFDEEAIADLAESIRQHGIIQPLTVRRLDSGYYQIIAGERRWRASKLAGLKEVPALIIEADERKVMELGLIENLQRQDLNPIEEALGFRVLMEDHGLTQDEVSNRVGKSRPAVANALRLIALPDSIRALVEEGQLSAGHARAVLVAPSATLQKNLAKKIIDEGMSVRQAEALAKRLVQQHEDKDDKPKAEDPLKIYREAAAKELSNKWGRKVSIHKTANKGTLEFEFYDDDDLTNLLDLFEAMKGGSEL